MTDELNLQNIEFVDYFLAETELIERLCISKSDKKINFGLFSNLLSKPVGHDIYQEYTGFHIMINVLRERLGFSAYEKPGDFDILIIPHSSENIFFNRTCAIEVKVVRPTRKNPKKAPSSNGYTQVQGLIKDGFPLVGLIHICMTEPLLENEKQSIKFDLMPFDLDNAYNNKDFLKNTVNLKVDTFSWFSAENQMKRLISKEIPKYVGLCTVGVNVSSENNLVTCFNLDFNTRYEAGYFNPHLKTETIQKIEHFWNMNKNSFIHAGK